VRERAKDIIRSVPFLGPLLRRLGGIPDGGPRSLPEAMLWNVKNMGLELARQREPFLTAHSLPMVPRKVGLVSKATTQADMESPWFAAWCSELKVKPIYHRKLWEFAFLLQALHDRDLLNTGVKGVGFGCGEEPLASYFASKGMDVTVTDLHPEKVARMDWAASSEHASSADKVFLPHLVSREAFDRHVTHRFADMNRIPDLGGPFDFVWSICAMEHLGSIEKGLAFVESSLRLLKPGGVAVHTTEFNYTSKDATIDRGFTVLFLRKHFEELAARLSAKGHRMVGPDFNVGDGVLDRHIDVPPYTLGTQDSTRGQWGTAGEAHIKLMVYTYPCTCFGVLVEKSRF
jgi:2-polyprenyl-3-methyl-5-hydroxy-6-metoxy-1,4-benzoquinol methylase